MILFAQHEFRVKKRKRDINHQKWMTICHADGYIQ